MGLSRKFGIEFTGDATKDILVIPRILLKLVGLWPDTLNIRTKLYPITMYVLLVLLLAGQLVFFVLNISNITKMAETLITISVSFQAFIKIPTIYVYSGKLKNLNMIMLKYFWSSNLLGVELEKSLKYDAKIVTTAMLFVHSSGLIYMTSFLAIPAIFGTRELPLASSYPFDWTKSPIYQLVYFLQSSTYVLFALNGISGIDSLFYAIISNSVAQFKLLRPILLKIGSPEIEDINKKLDQYYDADEDDKRFSGNTKLLYRCIEHHRKLIGMCNDMERIFALSIATQFLASLTAICVSSYLITVIGFDFSQLIHLFPYVVGHLTQLFLFCTAGNELTYQANSLSTHIFNSQWYESHVTRDVKRALPVVTQRSQKCQKLTALGIVDLNYNTFLNVLQLSFSFYTLLSKMTETK